MFYYKYNLMHDGEFAYGSNDFNEVLDEYRAAVGLTDTDHEWQILELLSIPQ